MTRRGWIRQNAIILDEPPSLPDGTEVYVDVRPVGGVSHPLLKAFGSLADVAEWDEILMQLYEERRRPNRPEPAL